MLTVEIREKEVKREYDSSLEIKKYIIVNGIADEDSYYLDTFDEPYVHCYNEEVIKILCSFSFIDVFDSFYKVAFDVRTQWWNDVFLSEIYSELNDNNEITPIIRLRLQITDWERWAKPWSILSLVQRFEINVHELSHENIKYWQDDDESVLNGFGIEFFPTSYSLIIESELSEVLTILQTLIEKTNQDLLASIDSDSLVTFYRFPEEIKTACKQYLIYFAQFLADIGIEVEAEIKEEVHQTLFKVTPKDKNESLERIREALNMYLSAPGDSNFEIQVEQQPDIAAQQWGAQVYFFKSQILLLKQAMMAMEERLQARDERLQAKDERLQAKDETIEMLRLTNYQLKQSIEASPTKKESDKEAIIPGFLSAGEYKKGGFTINWAIPFRFLKRVFKKKE